MNVALVVAVWSFPINPVPIVYIVILGHLV